MNRFEQNRPLFFTRMLRSVLFSAILFLAMAAVMGIAGCGHDSSEPESKPMPPSEPAAEQKTESAAVEPSRSDRKRPEPIAGVTAEQLLREMLDVYRKAKLYADHGVIETVYQTDERTPVTERVPCTVIFKKPNYLRMEVGGGLLTCDGQKMKARLLDPFYESQTLERPAPLLFSSIRELYPDIKLADAMDLGTPTDIFWTPPQLILLFAREPLRTFVPKDVRPQLLEPDWFDPLDGSEPIACDRVAIPAENGTRTLWIDRKTKGLVRFEFPLEQIPVPEGVRRVLSMTMSFPNQVISEDPNVATFEPDLFTIKPMPGEEIVERFLSPELFIFGKKAPPIRIEPLADGYSAVRLDEPSGKCRVICLWGGGSERDLPIWERSCAVLKEVERSFKAHEGESDFEFFAVNLDPAARTDAQVRAEYGDIGVSVPIYRMNLSEMHKTIFSKIAVPSLILIDKNGIVQKYCPSPQAFVKLQYMLEQIHQGQDIYKEDFRGFEILSENFLDTVASAETLDLYRTEETPQETNTPVAALMESSYFSISPEWSADLLDPANPMAVETPDGAAVIVPSEGNVLTIFNGGGEVQRKRIPETAAGEPISFVRTILTKGGKRYYAASSFLDSRKVHLFNESFDLLGTLDFTQRQQWVADALLTDTGADDRPEIVLSLVGDSASNLIPTHGVYAVEVIPDKKKSDFIWRDEMVVSPFCIGTRIDTSSGEAEVIALNFPVDEMGKLTIDSQADGKRLAEVEPPAGVSILWFTTDETGVSDKIAALIARAGNERPSFALLNRSGEILAETPLETGTWNAQMERILPFDLNGDGSIEWIVPTTEGLVRIFGDDGQLMDQFARGVELAGLGVGKWGGKTHLIFAESNQIISAAVGAKEPENNPAP